jgi:homoserine/homoserine lactone efflux protein
VRHLLHEAWSLDGEPSAADAARVFREAGAGTLTLIHLDPRLADPAALVAAAAPLFVAIKWFGVAYLAWLGLAEWRDALRGAGLRPSAARGAPAPFAMWRQGVLLQLANPKAILFFTALLPQFVDPARPVAMQFIVLGVISIVVELPVLLLYGYAADRGRARYGRHAPLFQRLAGACLIAAGAKLAAMRA